jgi:hypothetical protein
VSSPAVSRLQLLTMEILQFPASTPFPADHRLTTELN